MFVFQGGSQPPKKDFIYEAKEGYERFVQIRDFANPEKFKTYIPKSNKNKRCDYDDILIGRYGASVGEICTGLKGAYNVALIKCINDKDKLSNKFLYYYLKSKIIQDKIISLSARAAQAGVNPKHLNEFNLPLPSLKEQIQIVEELDGYQKIIDGCRQVIENYKPSIDIEPNWEVEEIGNICELNPKKSEVELDNNSDVSFLPMEDVKENDLLTFPHKTKKLSEVTSSYTYFKTDDILLAKVTPCFENGKCTIAKDLVNGVGFGSSEFIVLRCMKK